MKIVILLLAFFAGIRLCNGQYHYPITKTVDSADTYWGVRLTDPYRWLEDMKNPEVQDWFKSQADYTKSQLAKIPGYDKLVGELSGIDALRSSRYAPIAKSGGKYFYRKRLPSEQVFKLYCAEAGSGKETLLFDPQQLAEGKTFDFDATVSDDGSKVLLTISESGSEVGDIRIMDVSTGQFLADKIQHAGATGFIRGSATEVIYIEYKSYDVHDPANMLNMSCKLHHIGAPGSADLVIAGSAKDPELQFRDEEIPLVVTFPDCPYMFLGKYTTENYITIYYAPLQDIKKEKISWKQLTAREDEVYDYIPHGHDIYILTSKGNDRFNVVKTSLEHPDLKIPKIICEGNDEWKLSGIIYCKDFLIINRSKNGIISGAMSYGFKSGQLAALNPPLTGNISGGGLSWNDNEILLTNFGWNVPHRYYTFDVSDNKLRPGPFATTPGDLGLDNLVIEEVEVPSYDGVMVPLSIIYDKTKARKDGTATGYVYGYGAYGMSITPVFHWELLPLLRRGVVFAVPHVRGGGEKGSAWHMAGRKNTKPNTWKDFIACTEYLVNKGYVASRKIAAVSGSAGGIMIGRAITERPDLYKVAIPSAAVLSTLRMELEPNGPVNIPEFGTVNDSLEFRGLLEMDAYQHIRKGTEYPAQLIKTGINDPRVASYNPAKFAARMQAENAAVNPVLLDINYNAGHFGGNTMDEYFAEQARNFVFLLWQTGHPDFQPQE